MKYNATSLQKLKKVVVLNKFLDVEARINTLSELIPQLKINVDLLTQESQKVYAGLQVEIFPEAQDSAAENSGD